MVRELLYGEGMRLLCTASLLLMTACAARPLVVYGTADLTIAPSVGHPGISRSAKIKTTACFPREDPSVLTFPLGPGCVLRGAFYRTARAYGGTAVLSGGQRCTLSIDGIETSLYVTSGTIRETSTANVDVVLAGVTEDADSRQVTLHYVAAEYDALDEKCAQR